MTSKMIISDLLTASKWLIANCNFTNAKIVNVCERTVKFVKHQQNELDSVKKKADEWHREAELTAEKLDGAINAQETLQKALAQAEAKVESKSAVMGTMARCIEIQEKEIERLQKYNADIAFKHYKQGIKDGINKFAERLKPRVDCEYGNKFYRDKCYEEIDNLVKEMVGEG